MLNLNCVSGGVRKDRERFLVGFSVITAVSDFALKKKIKYVDELATVITGQLG